MRVTNWKKKALTALAAGGVVGLGANGASADITTTLDGLTSTNAPVPADHGTTAETTLTWDGNLGGWDQYNGWPNDPGNGVYQIDGDDVTIVFAPVNGQTAITISDFDLNSWAGGGDQLVTWTIYDGAGTAGSVLATADTTTPEGTVRNYVPNYSGTDGQTLTLRFQQTGGTGSYLAMDNLTFSSTVNAVPEPTSAVVVALGLGALSMRRRRKS